MAERNKYTAEVLMGVKAKLEDGTATLEEIANDLKTKVPTLQANINYHFGEGSQTLTSEQKEQLKSA